MRTLSFALVPLIATALQAGCESSHSVRTSNDTTATGPAAQVASADAPHLYSGFGNYTRKVTTSSREAQRWFDQGIQLLYGFNHDEAIRSFREAARLDPGCAMAWWGVSYAHGLHINNPVMTETQSRNGDEAAKRALAALDNETPVEQALVRAVAKRYAWPAPADRKPLDEAYAAEMEKAWKTFPDDPDVGALFAESLMNLQPWNYWTHDGQPKGRIKEIVAALERAMTINPQHPGANHFYIHAVEASGSPERALTAATRLGKLVPGSGHLVHMPSHIWIRTGQYALAADTNERAVAVDAAYFKIAPPPVFYNVYYIHNLHFLAYAAMFEGRYAKAMEAARRLEREAPESFIREYAPAADGLTPVALHVMVRFGKWEDILKEPEAAEYRKISRLTRHYARGVAFAALGRVEEARGELAAYNDVAATVGEEWFVGNNPAKDVLPIPRLMMEGEILYREGRKDEAFAKMREAVKGEENLNYDEPPGWMQPVRHALGALLLESSRAAEAEEVYRADLTRHPGNGWSLLGLRRSLEAQGKNADAAGADAQLAKAWKRADVKPQASCYCAKGT